MRGHGCAPGVRDPDGSGGCSDALGRGALTTVGEGHDAAELVQSLDHLVPIGAEAGVPRLQAPVADEIADVVGQLDDAYAKVVEDLNPREVALLRCRVLKAEYDADTTRFLGVVKLLD